MFDVLIGAAIEATNHDREWAAQRPSRATYSVARDASQVPDGWEDFARCVEQRESNGQAGVVNSSSGAAGLFQFMPAWRTGLPYMVRDRLVRFGMPKAIARQIRLDLSATRIEDWNPIWQRIGFAEVIDRGGDEHWTLRGSRCEQYRR